ncbi:hypothetical protein LOZ53_003155 [Ophidiomyces ophidiicola]|nr:hypothetical protein LOZ53_003155 [Ophidiomyces ophidiicola]
MDPTPAITNASSCSCKDPEPPPIVTLPSFGFPGDSPPSLYGTGTPDVLKVIKILENAGICCCLVGVSALKYYGAERVRHDWEVCVPTDLLKKASQIFESEPHSQVYQAFPDETPQLGCLYHTFPRFKIRGVTLYFVIIPAEDAYLKCVPSNIERSQMGLPYPTLPVFAQSLLDTDSEVALTDLIDGMNLTEEWGLKHLNLDGTNDVVWAFRKNEKIRSSVPLTDYSCLLELATHATSKMETWKRIVGTKENRIGFELPKEYYASRFYAKTSGDPRLEKRIYV